MALRDILYCLRCLSVTNSSESGELTSQALACRQQHIDDTVGGTQWKESCALEASAAIITESGRWLVLNNGCGGRKDK